MRYIFTILLSLPILLSTFSYAEERLDLETTVIKGNVELPKILFVVPWQDVEKNQYNDDAGQIQLHSLFGDIFDPLEPQNSLYDIEVIE